VKEQARGGGILKNVECILTKARNTTKETTAPPKLRSLESAGNILLKNVMIEVEKNRNLE